MLLQNNDTAKYIRNRILDIVIDVLAEKTGGSTKYINQKDPEINNLQYKLPLQDKGKSR